MNDSEKFDGMLLAMAQQHEGGVKQLLHTFFGFLYRKTDFFHGAAPGVPRQTVIDSMREFEEHAEKKRREVLKEKEEREQKLKENREKQKQREAEEFAKVSSSDSSPKIEEVTDDEANKIIEENKRNQKVEENKETDEASKEDKTLSAWPIFVDHGDEKFNLNNQNLNHPSSKNKRKCKSEKKQSTSPKRVGRPTVDFDRSRAKQLISLGFTMVQISNALGISDGTLRRFRNQNKDCKLYNEITDEELDSKISAIKSENSQIGEKRLLGLLKSKGIRVQRKRLRESIHRVDPNGPLLRCNKGIALVNARTSTVPVCAATQNKSKSLKSENGGIQIPPNCPKPNSLWRCESVSKLERWKILVSFSLDMFSRFMTFAVASNINSAQDSLFVCFKSATERYSCPSMLNTDERIEKASMLNYMIEEKGEASVEISSKLERVQWITVIKNDLNFNIFNNLILTFEQLEEEGALNLNNNTDLFCLHFVYLPRINRLLQDFMLGYNSCCIPHGSGATPLQIFYAHNDSALVNKDILPNLINMPNETVIQISLAEDCPVSEEKLIELCQHVNPEEKSENNGKDLYYKTATFVSQFLQNSFESHLDTENVFLAENNENLSFEVIADINDDLSNTNKNCEKSGNSYLAVAVENEKLELYKDDFFTDVVTLKSE